MSHDVSKSGLLELLCNLESLHVSQGVLDFGLTEFIRVRLLFLLYKGILSGQGLSKD